MEKQAIEKIISKERLRPYLKYHTGDFQKAIAHYKANIEISETFYPMLSILEIGLRNNFDFQLKRKFNDENWFENLEFIKIVSHFQIDRVSEARNNILREKKTIATGKFRNRIFHYESVTWSITALTNYKNEIIEGIDWLDKDLLEWSEELFRFDEIIKKKEKWIL